MQRTLLNLWYYKIESRIVKMKKIKILVISLFLIICVTGCGNDTKVLECTTKSEGTNMNAYANVKYTFKKDKLKKAEFEVEFKDITATELQANWSTLVEQFTSQNEPVEEKGYTRKVKNDDKNYIFTVIVSVDYDKISKETMDKYGIEDSSNKSYVEIKELALKEEDTTCK